jgi:hypothetical protein
MARPACRRTCWYTHGDVPLGRGRLSPRPLHPHSGIHRYDRRHILCRGSSVILVNDERSVTLSDKAERPEKKRQSAPGFAVKRAVIKSWRVFSWSNQPQKALTYFIIRFVSGPLPGLASAWRGRNPRLTFKFNHP